MWVEKHPGLVAGLLLTPPAAIAGLISAGFGHGSYVMARVVLPLACAFIELGFATSFLVPVAALVQWPLYGVLLDMSKRKSVTASLIAVVHVGLCVWLFTGGLMAFR